MFENLKGEKYRPLFDRAEAQYSLPQGLLFRQAFQESRFRDDIVSGETRSPAGAVGIMQIIPKWHPEIGERGALDPAIAIPYAAKFMRQLYNQFGSWEKALAAYNWGPGNLQKQPDPYKWPTETRNYVTSIARDVPAVLNA